MLRCSGALGFPVHIYDKHLCSDDSSYQHRLRYQDSMAGTFRFLKSDGDVNFQPCDLVIFQVCGGDSDHAEILKLLAEHSPRPTA